MNASFEIPKSAPSVTELLSQHYDKELLRFITCGNVDDGKSTLIGRLLLEAGAVYEDQLQMLQAESARHGNAGGELDPALLLDGLEDERQQGITIDVAYRYFTTARRKFIIADTPGHEQYTRNMVTAASIVDLAVLLIDAEQGLKTQTRRHAFLVSLLGVKHVVLAVNKMDLVGYSQERFESICQQFRDFAQKLDLIDVRFVPLSALRGENVATLSDRMPWFQETPLLPLLESIYTASDANQKDMRFPVQWVNRPNSEFRGFAGTVASGTLRAGDDVVVLPSGVATKIQSIETMDGSLPEASSGDSVTLTLTDQVDVVRGDLLVRPGNRPHVRRTASATLVWMSETPLQPGRNYAFKQLGQKTVAEVDQVRYAIDVNTLHRKTQPSLRLNEIGRCQLSFRTPVVHDAYRQNRQTGSFILVDRSSHETVAAGMFDTMGNDDRQADWWPEQRVGLAASDSTTSLVSPEQRKAAYSHRPLTILISGACGAGKTTVARLLEQALFEMGKTTVLIDGHQLRAGMSRDLGFAIEDRSENLRRATEIARLLNASGLICILSLMAPEESVREKARQLIGQQQFFHVHLNVSIDIARQRDQTGIYDAVKNGTLSAVPGIDATYERPAEADLIINTDTATPERIVDLILEQIAERW